MRLLKQINLHAFRNATDLIQSIYEDNFEIKGSMKHRQNIRYLSPVEGIFLVMLIDFTIIHRTVHKFYGNMCDK